MIECCRDLPASICLPAVTKKNVSDLCVNGETLVAV